MNDLLSINFDWGTLWTRDARTPAQTGITPIRVHLKAAAPHLCDDHVPKMWQSRTSAEGKPRTRRCMRRLRCPHSEYQPRHH